MNRQMAQAASLVLRNPLDPAFKIRWMAQFTTEYLREFVHILREEVHVSHLKWVHLSTSVKVSDRDVQAALRRKRMVIGRLTAVIRELETRGEEVPRLRIAK